MSTRITDYDNFNIKNDEKRSVFNTKNKIFIDRYICENYNILKEKYSIGRFKTDSSGAGSFDKLDKTLFNAYTNIELDFSDYKTAKAYLDNKFKAKEFRAKLENNIAKENFEEENQEETEEGNSDFYSEIE